MLEWCWTYERCKTVVRCALGVTEEFKVGSASTFSSQTFQKQTLLSFVLFFSQFQFSLCVLEALCDFFGTIFFMCTLVYIHMQIKARLTSHTFVYMTMLEELSLCCSVITPSNARWWCRLFSAEL